MNSKSEISPIYQIEKKPKNEITVIINYKSEIRDSFKCDENEKTEIIFGKFCSKNKLQLNSLYFLYGGKLVTDDDYKKPIKEIMNKLDQERKEITILSYLLNDSNNPSQPDNDEINIMLVVDSEKTIKIKGKKSQAINLNLSEAIKDIDDINNLNFNYGVNEIDINKKFEEIANEHDKKGRCMTLKVNYKKIKVNFKNKSGNLMKSYSCLGKNKLKDLCNKYAQDINGADYNNSGLIFTYNNQPINFENDLDQLIKEHNNANDNNLNQTNIENNNINNNREINIEVSQNKCHCFKKNKKLIIILSVAGAVILIGLIILLLFLLKRKKKKNDLYNEYELPIRKCDEGYFIPDDDQSRWNCQKCSLKGCKKCSGKYWNDECFDCGNLQSVYENNKITECKCTIGEDENCSKCDYDTNECEQCNIGYELINGKCKTDYFLKVVYYVDNAEEEIELINDIETITHMYIEGEKIIKYWNTKNTYKFKEAGNQTVYFQFNYRSYYNNLYFKDNKYIISAEFSDFNEDKGDIIFYSMFAGCTNLAKVDFSKLSYPSEVNLNDIFSGCSNLKYVNFNNLSIYSAENMFKDCISIKFIDFSKANVSNLKYINNMFSNCISLESVDLTGFNISEAQNMSYIFYNCYSLKYLDLSHFNVSEITNMEYAFYNCNSLEYLDLSDFKVSELTNMEYSFYNCYSIKYLDLSYFNVSKLTNMEYAFYNCCSLEYLDLSDFKVSELTNMEYAFYNCYSLKFLDLSDFKVSEYTSMEYAFYNCYSLEYLDLSDFKANNMEYAFYNCYSLKYLDLSDFKVSEYTDMEYAFYNCYSLEYLDLSDFKVYNMEYAFYNCKALTSINFENFRTDSLQNLNHLFYNCSSLKQIDLSGFYVQYAYSMKSMFEGCSSLTSIIISQTSSNQFYVGSNVRNIKSMFSGCHSLTNIDFEININDRMSSLANLFSDCYSLESVNFNRLDISNINNYSYMFHNCYNLTSIELEHFYIKENADLRNMFSGCYSLTSVAFPNKSSTYYMFDEIFYDCPNLNYVDFSLAHNYPTYYDSSQSFYLFNHNISENGTLILNREFYETNLENLNIYPPKNWKLELIDN